MRNPFSFKNGRGHQVQKSQACPQVATSDRILTACRNADNPPQVIRCSDQTEDISACRKAVAHPQLGNPHTVRLRRSCRAGLEVELEHLFQSDLRNRQLMTGVP
jgi:hypothetical protein